MEGVVAKAAMGRGKGGNEHGVEGKGVRVGGEGLEEGEELGLQRVREGGVPVKGGGRGGGGGMVVDIRG